MTRALFLTPAFVATVPEALRPGTLYVSLPFATALHLCACGCGAEVVTPIAPDSWSLAWDGEAVSLRPSVGNARLPCRSHYLVVAGRIVWLPDLAEDRGPGSGFPPGGVGAWLARVWRRVGDAARRRP